MGIPLKQFINRTFAITAICAAITGVLVYFTYHPQPIDKLWLKNVYGNIRPLDKDGRVYIVELQESNSNVRRKLRFYDMKRREFIHQDPYRDIYEVREVRDGAYALLGHNGMQLYTLVMPYATESWVDWSEDKVSLVDCVRKYWFEDPDRYTDLNLTGSIKDVEAKLVKLYNETSQCGYPLIDYVIKHPSTLYYDFKKLAEATDVNILTSEDGKLRFYTWDTGCGGTSPDYVAYVQYDNGKNITTDFFYPYSGSKYACEYDVVKDGYNVYESGYVGKLHQMEDENDGVIYIPVSVQKSSSIEGSSQAFAMQIKDGKLVKLEFVDAQGDACNSAEVVYYIPDWYFTTDGLGWDWVMEFDEKTKTLYVPESLDNSVLIDKYQLYRYEQGRMVCKDRGAGFWLNPSLHEYGSLVGIYQTPTKFIRIDYLGGRNGYRYACWNKSKTMLDAPDLVLTGGDDEMIANAIVFTKDDYEYIVPAFRKGQGNDFGEVIIKKKGKVIMQSKV